MNETASPESLDELREIVLGSESILPVGNRTKPPLSKTDAAVVSTCSLSGIVQYEPSEFTFTALAGTPVREISEALADRGQYLPFDPVLQQAGATIGGTVASGLSGSGRFRYGGIRDFLLGVRFLSGEGEWIQSGGKVVKNAAGFDIPKFLVGSLGRYGVMAELTFKVFPRPVAAHSLSVACESHQQAQERMSRAANSRWELDAIDYRPAQSSIQLRLGGPPVANESIAGEIAGQWGDDVAPLEEAEQYWRGVRELQFDSCDTVVKVPTTGQSMIQICDSLGATAARWASEGVQLHVALAGNLVWIAVDGAARLSSIDSLLQSLGLAGLVVRGEGDCLIGTQQDSQMRRAMKRAMDPGGRFPDP